MLERHRHEASARCAPGAIAETSERSSQGRLVSGGMLIINADDWGGWKSATDAALACYEKNRITSVSAMVFMDDSERAAALARDLGMDVGLHVNLNQDFSASHCPTHLKQNHSRIKRFLKRNRYAQVLYNPFLRKEFRDVYEAQAEEFVRLYGKQPSHIDGHRHMHLCTNMLLDGVIPPGQKVRRSFSFWPGEKSSLNRAYRGFVDKRLVRRHRTTDYFFALSQCLQGKRLARVTELAKEAKVELMAHPEKVEEYAWLMSDDYLRVVRDLQTATYQLV
ncbi:MAG TPA: ChbG/HpnK family deacetylase [Haliangiales bacterium]|nr:ChbG/HpnK family deacetylase [Haliangiales bacterium]